MNQMTTDTGKLLEAIEFASEKHKNQFRKNKDKTPYIHHPVQVARTISRHVQNVDNDVLIAAVLHDVLEDTDTSRVELENTFGKKIASIVLEVTDNKNQPKLLRKLLQIKNAKKKSIEAKTIAVADKICNLTDIINDPPVNWNPQRKNMYTDWVEQVVKGMKGANPRLDQLVEEKIRLSRDKWGK